MFYRYFNLTYGLEALQTGRWKIGRIGELNDPFDCRPHFLNLPKKVTGESRFPDEYLNVLNAGFGLLCFSELISDPVVWAHYSDSQRGLALGFDFSDAPFPIEKVHYSDTRPEVDIGISTDSSEDKEKLREAIAKGFTTKAESWRYETEYRYLVSLDKCGLVGPHYFGGVPVKFLKEIVLGARCTMTMRDIKRVVHPSKDAPRYLAPTGVDYSESLVMRRCEISETGFALDFDTFTDQ
jgi:Protein of unknown function (DUF2971)